MSTYCNWILHRHQQGSEVVLLPHFAGGKSELKDHVLRMRGEVDADLGWFCSTAWAPPVMLVCLLQAMLTLWGCMQEEEKVMHKRTTFLRRWKSGIGRTRIQKDSNSGGMIVSVREGHGLWLGKRPYQLFQICCLVLPGPELALCTAQACGCPDKLLQKVFHGCGDWIVKGKLAPCFWWDS